MFGIHAAPRQEGQWAWTLSLALFFAATSFAAPPDTKECKPSFPFQGEWLGADAAYSIPISDGRVVWIFGDTLIGKERVVTGDTPRMVRNSIGVSTCDPTKGWKIDYAIRKDSSGQSLDFFQSPSKAHWYWALDGFFHKDTLWVSLLCIRDKPVEGSAAMAFETCGGDLAKVSNLSASPQQWKVDVFPLVPDGVKAYPSSTAVVSGEHAYIFASYEKPPSPMLLTRIPLNGLAAPKENLQYLANDDSWKPGLDPSNAKYVMTPGASEMSVRYHPGLKKWVAVMIGQPFPSDKILFRTAPELAGPWSDGQVIHRIAEMQPSSPGYDKDTFCYAAKEHPEFEAPGNLFFTYVCNSFTVSKVAKMPSIYFPQTVTMPMPKGD
jgi:hypothetical protein